MEGTAARLFILTSIKSTQRFFGANSSKYTAAPTPTGTATKSTTASIYTEPINAPNKPAEAGELRESELLNKAVENFSFKWPSACIWSAKARTGAASCCWWSGKERSILPRNHTSTLASANKLKFTLVPKSCGCSLNSSRTWCCAARVNKAWAWRLFNVCSG